MQIATAVGPTTDDEQVVVVYALPAIGNAGTHAATSVGPVLLVPQVIVSQPLPALPVCGVHEGTPVGPVRMLLQTTPWPLPFGALGVQLETATGAPLTVWQSVATQPLPAFAATAVQVPTSVQGWTTVVAQVVAVNALPPFATAGVQVATPVGPVLIVWHSVVV